MGSSGIPKSNGAGSQPPQKTDGLPTQIPTGMSKAYPASKAPAIKKWFQTMFPSLSGKQLDQAVGQFMQIQMQFLQHVMSQLQKQQEASLKRLKDSEEGRE